MLLAIPVRWGRGKGRERRFQPALFILSDNRGFPGMGCDREGEKNESLEDGI